MEITALRSKLGATNSALTGRKRELLESFLNVRKMTFEILEPLEIEDFVVQTDAFMSPPRWHVGHTTWFYEQLLKSYYPDFKPFHKDLAFYFNSYYLTYGKLFNKAKRGTISRPTVKETFEYAEFINNQVIKFFEDDRTEITEEMDKNFLIGYNHEWQHQELIVYDLQHLLADDYKPVNIIELPHKNGHIVKQEMIKIPEGMFMLGFDNKKFPDRFAYDIEMPAHKVFINKYSIDKYPVTNGHYLEFINAKGYDNFHYWLSDGWYWRNDNQIIAPLYWSQDENGKWFKYDFRGKVFINDILNEPVTNISYFEADAFAKWSGKRLPTEAEWEKAASFNEDTGENNLFPWGNDDPDESKCNLLGFNIWKPVNVNFYEQGKSHYGCYGMIGDTWEWTSSEFMPYPGFKTGFEEYNDKWFCNQKVLRGGSFGTHYLSTKNAYRNFFKTHERWLISGFRCVKDEI